MPRQGMIQNFSGGWQLDATKLMVGGSLGTNTPLKTILGCMQYYSVKGATTFQLSHIWQGEGIGNNVHFESPV